LDGKCNVSVYAGPSASTKGYALPTLSLTFEYAWEDREAKEMLLEAIRRSGVLGDMQIWLEKYLFGGIRA
jgi:hypothetical protein